MKSKIGHKLVIAIVVFSSLITLITTALQIYLDYRADLKRVNNYESVIKESYLKTITSSVWMYDEKQILSLLSGILNFPDMELLKIVSTEGPIWSDGSVKSKRNVTQEFPLIYRYKGDDVAIGSLNAVISLDGIYARLVNKAVIILISNGLKTFLVSGFILLIFQHLVTRHLYAFSSWLKNLDIGRSFEKFSLNRPAQKYGKKDELDEIVLATNEMQSKLKNYLSDIIESEKKFRTLVTNTEEIIYMTDKEGKFVLSQGKGLCALGLKPDEVVGESVFELYKDYPDMLEIIRKALEGESRTTEVKIGDIHFRSWFTPHKNQGGDIIGMLGLSVNITEQKKIEEALKKSQERLNLVILGSNDAPWDWDLINKDRYYSPQWWAQLGYEPDELPADAALWERFMHPDDKIHVDAMFGNALNGGVKSYEVEFRLLHKEGHYVPILSRGIITRDETDQPIRVTGTNMDLSIRKQQAEKYKKTIESSIDGFWIVDLKGKFIEVNEAYSNMIGYRRDELLKMSISDVEAIEHPEEITQRIEKIIRTGSDRFESKHRHKKGHIIDVEVSANYTHGSDGLFFVFLRDRTDINRMEERLRQAQKMESIGNLAGGIAHDFNNLLFPIVGMSEMLLEDLPQDSIEYENAQEIFIAGKRAGELVKQILAFSRQSEHKMTPVRIQNVLKEVLNLSRSTIPANIKLYDNIQQNCGLILADPTQVHQVAMNLITNAFHAVEEKNGIINIGIEEVTVNTYEQPDNMLQPGQYVRLSVSDNGIGMEQKIIDKIFEPYFTTKEKGKGTGLGLAVVYGIVKEHKGDIKIYSEVGKGTTFNVYFPLMKKVEQEAPSNKTEIVQTGTERILLVDDEVSVARLEQQMLERFGYEVTSRTSSVDALDRFRASPNSFDIVITDMSMPNMTGDQLALELITIRPDIPVIICTGFSERINKEKAEAYGIKGFLMKPVVKSDMAKIVRKVLDEVKGSA